MNTNLEWEIFEQGQLEDLNGKKLIKLVSFCVVWEVKIKRPTWQEPQNIFEVAFYTSQEPLDR